jgi:hypothetical protein
MQVRMEISQGVLRGEGKYIPSGEVIMSRLSWLLLPIGFSISFLLNSFKKKTQPLP